MSWSAVLALTIGSFLLIVGLVFTPVGIQYSDDYNAGYSTITYTCQVTGYNVDERVCDRNTCFYGYVYFSIKELDKENVEYLAIVNFYTSSVSKTKNDLMNQFPLNSTAPCYYGSSGITFNLIPKLNSSTIAGIATLALGTVLYITWALTALVFYIFRRN